MQRILILGSQGQVGSYLSTHCKNLGFDVAEIDLVNSVNQDLRDFQNEVIKSHIASADFIYFLAFDVGGSTYLAHYQNTFDFISNNIRIMENVFSQIRKSKTPFIFASSQMSNMSISTYGLLKQIGEQYTKSLGGLTVKFWNVYGIERDKSKFHVISDFIYMAQKSKRIILKTNGEETRDFLYAKDCTWGLNTIKENYEHLRQHASVDIAQFKWTSILEVAQIIGEYFQVEVVPGTKTDLLQANIKNEPNRDILDFWQPRFTIHSGIAEVIAESK